jgi:hypothetical protein
MDLFSMGVIDDADRPRQHKPAPVRCLEDELLPPTPKVERCNRCHNHAIAGKAICTVCLRKGQLLIKTRKHSRSEKALDAKRFIRLRASMMRSDGILAQTPTNARALTAFVEAGNARWATPRDLRRLGRDENGQRIAILIGWPK